MKSKGLETVYEHEMTNVEIISIFMAKKAPPTGLVRISWCTTSVDYHFCSENRLSEILTSFPENAQGVNLKNSDLDLI